MPPPTAAVKPSSPAGLFLTERCRTPLAALALSSTTETTQRVRPSIPLEPTVQLVMMPQGDVGFLGPAALVAAGLPTSSSPGAAAAAAHVCHFLLCNYNIYVLIYAYLYIYMYMYVYTCVYVYLYNFICIVCPFSTLTAFSVHVGTCPPYTPRPPLPALLCRPDPRRHVGGVHDPTIWSQQNVPAGVHQEHGRAAFRLC